MPLRRVRVLLVEDNPDDAVLFLRVRGPRHGDASPVHVETLHAAFERLDDGGIDIVLLDLSLPDASGVETVTRVLDHAPEVPVVVLTGLDDEEVGRQAIQAGAQDYIIKNHLDRRTLDRCIRYALERHGWALQQREDTRVNAALAAAGERLMAVAGSAAIPGELCRIARELTEAEFAHTWLERELEGDLQPRAAEPAEEWDRLREASLDRRWPVTAAPEPVPPYDAASIVRIPLRRGDRIVGTIVCGDRDGGHEVARSRVRIANGLELLGSLALENARLFDELEEAARAKSYFAATMSHELRNTLSVIIGFTDLLLRNENSPNGPRREDLLQVVKNRSNESLQIIQATLELTRSEAISTAPTWAVTDIESVVDEVVDDTIIPADKPSLVVRRVSEESLPPIRTDATKLRMVVRNLLTNAIKFSKEGTIEVRTAVHDDRVRISVSDPGRGIAESVLPTLFEPFRQAPESGARIAGGVGLGLYICRQLARMLGGDVRARSSLGSGSTFEVELPLVPPAPDTCG